MIKQWRKLIYGSISLVSQITYRLGDIYDYIQQDSRENARAFINEIISEAIKTPDFPLAGRVVTEFRDLKTREKIYKNYRIIYRVQSESIELITILHQARRLNKHDY